MLFIVERVHVSPRQRPKGRPIARVTFYTTLGTGHSNTGRDVGIGVGVGAAVIVLGAPSIEAHLSQPSRVVGHDGH